MRLQGPQSMNVDHIYDEPVLRPETRCGRLRQEERRLQVAAYKIVPLRQSDLADRSWVEARRVVDQNIQTPKFEQRRRDQFIRRVGIQEMRGKDCRGMRPHPVEFVRQ